jgi:hypothetical protein
MTSTETLGLSRHFAGWGHRFRRQSPAAETHEFPIYTHFAARIRVRTPGGVKQRGEKFRTKTTWLPTNNSNAD